MPNEIITMGVNLSLLDKSKFIKGKKGTYVDLVLIPTPNSEYGSHMVKQNSTKEDREAGKKLPILGNAKTRATKGGKQAQGNGGSSDDDLGDW